MWSRFFAVTILALVFATSAWTPTASRSQRAYVDAAVATVWTSPAAPRAIDRPALGNPVDLHSWNRSLNTLARRGLVGRIQTQALYGEGVEVLGHRGSWTHVTVSDQPTPRNSRGYPGWIPTAQLTAGRRFGALLQGRTAVVVRPTAVLRGVGGLLELSYGTRLPLLGTVGSDLLVLTPDGRTGRLPRNAVSTLELAGKKRQASGRKIVSAARMFLRVRYLWGGTSAFGFDCSGLIELIFRAAGFVIPRDADAQALGGHRVARSRILPGDLLFYGRRHVHHVTLYVGSGTMIEAPNSASSVHLSPVRSADYAGARRYIRP
ncbi:MAG: C40 family peptidase [Gaiellaceae bacterium]